MDWHHDVVAWLLDELAVVYRGEKLGALARELSTLLTTTPVRATDRRARSPYR
jgi:hypothetical protein